MLVLCILRGTLSQLKLSVIKVSVNMRFLKKSGGKESQIYLFKNGKWVKKVSEKNSI